MHGSKLTSSLIKEAEIHESLGTHVTIGVTQPEDYTLRVCLSCYHILIFKNKKWKTIDKDDAKGISDYGFIESYMDKKTVVSIYERLNYFYVPCFAYSIARDVIKKPTKISKAIASLDEVYNFHYTNEIEGRSTPEAAKEFQRLLKKKLEF